jgi:hypothetical protein
MSFVSFYKPIDNTVHYFPINHLDKNFLFSYKNSEATFSIHLSINNFLLKSTVVMLYEGLKMLFHIKTKWKCEENKSIISDKT